MNSQTRLRLFCFPYAGGGASIFREWAADLPGEIEVCAVQIPGRENRWMEPLFTRLSPLIQILTQDLYPYLNTPFAFFGHSMGALISFELARQLRRQYGLEPGHLFVSGARAPQRRPNPFLPLHQLPDHAFIAELRRLNGTPAELLRDPGFMQVVLPILRADVAMCETYIYRAELPLSCPISAYGGLQDNGLRYQDLAAWRYQTRNRFKLRVFNGNHFFLCGAKKALLRSLSQDLLPILKQPYQRQHQMPTDSNNVAEDQISCRKRPWMVQVKTQFRRQIK